MFIWPISLQVRACVWFWLTGQFTWLWRRFLLNLSKISHSQLQGYLEKSLRRLLINYQILLLNFVGFNFEWLGEFDIASKVTHTLFHTPLQLSLLALHLLRHSNTGISSLSVSAHSFINYFKFYWNCPLFLRKWRIGFQIGLLGCLCLVAI